MTQEIRIGVPTGWGDVFVRAAKVAIVAFATLVVKEWLETHELDLKACSIDAAWVAAGLLATNVILYGLIPKTRG